MSAGWQHYNTQQRLRGNLARYQWTMLSSLVLGWGGWRILDRRLLSILVAFPFSLALWWVSEASFWLGGEITPDVDVDEKTEREYAWLDRVPRFGHLLMAYTMPLAKVLHHRGPVVVGHWRIGMLGSHVPALGAALIYAYLLLPLSPAIISLVFLVPQLGGFISLTLLAGYAAFAQSHAIHILEDAVDTAKEGEKW